MKQIVKIFSLLMVTLFMNLSFTSCGDDDKDKPDDKTYYDYSVEWLVVDRGDYKSLEAQEIADDLTETSEYIFEGYTEKAALKLFDEFCEQLRYAWGENYKKITLKAILIRTQGKKQLASKTFYINPNGTTIKSPAKGANVVIVND